MAKICVLYFSKDKDKVPALDQSGWFLQIRFKDLREQNRFWKSAIDHLTFLIFEYSICKEKIGLIEYYGILVSNYVSL